MSILFMGVWAFFFIMGITLTLIIFFAIVVGLIQGVKDAWSYWSIRRKYKL